MSPHPCRARISMRNSPSNAALEWQARCMEWRSSELMVACPLEGPVGLNREELNRNVRDLMMQLAFAWMVFLPKPTPSIQRIPLEASLIAGIPSRGSQQVCRPLARQHPHDMHSRAIHQSVSPPACQMFHPLYPYMNRTWTRIPFLPH